MSILSFVNKSNTVFFCLICYPYFEKVSGFVWELILNRKYSRINVALCFYSIYLKSLFCIQIFWCVKRNGFKIKYKNWISSPRHLRHLINLWRINFFFALFINCVIFHALNFVRWKQILFFCACEFSVWGIDNWRFRWQRASNCSCRNLKLSASNMSAFEVAER